ncbi:hypothetical protein RFI_05298, partial [Reticulomyxa filosa]
HKTTTSQIHDKCEDVFLLPVNCATDDESDVDNVNTSVATADDHHQDGDANINHKANDNNNNNNNNNNDNRKLSEELKGFHFDHEWANDERTDPLNLYV